MPFRFPIGLDPTELNQLGDIFDFFKDIFNFNFKFLNPILIQILYLF